ILAMVIIFFLVIFVAPVFADVYHQLNVLLPGPTIILLSISFMVRKFWLVLTAVIGGLYLFYHYYKNKEIGRLFFGWLSMNLPILGKFNSKVAVARFVRSLGDMLSCGVPVVDSLSITDKVVGNQVISSATAKIKTSVESGGKLTTALLKNEIFSPMVIQMVYAGEESGSLAEMLEKCADTLDRDVELSAKRLIVMLEPSLTLILAAVVGFIALAIYLPMFDLVRVVSQ
ncbi:MAG: type II secretion system F family protein, partial [Candidatus Margulisbacteria bacterium]|nr:type II secretion system F family protein [Candidatus Margulisiibacteriota bacterium]